MRTPLWAHLLSPEKDSSSEEDPGKGELSEEEGSESEESLTKSTILSCLRPDEWRLLETFEIKALLEHNLYLKRIGQKTIAGISPDQMASVAYARIKTYEMSFFPFAYTHVEGTTPESEAFLIKLELKPYVTSESYSASENRIAAAVTINAILNHLREYVMSPCASAKVCLIFFGSAEYNTVSPAAAVTPLRTLLSEQYYVPSFKTNVTGIERAFYITQKYYEDAESEGEDKTKDAAKSSDEYAEGSEELIEAEVI